MQNMNSNLHTEHKTMAPEPITDEDIQALVDGELSPARQEIVMKMIDSDVGLRERYRALRHQKMLLLSWWSEEQDRLH
jgi:anti-sigma factor RsiW